MSQNYKFKSLQIVEKSDETKKEKEITELNMFEIGETKTINFIMLDGSQQNFAYSYYITSWLGTEKNESIIKIFFATHLVTIAGYCLDIIYQNLHKLKLKSLLEQDERYLNTSKEQKPFIKKIKIEWRKKIE